MWTEDVRWSKDCRGGGFDCESTFKIFGNLFSFVHFTLYQKQPLMYHIALKYDQLNYRKPRSVVFLRK